MPKDYLRKILTAKVYDVARETELEVASHLSARIKNKVLLKREDNQPVFSFKLRVGHIAIGLSKVFLMTHDLLWRSLCALRGTTLALNIVDQSS